MDPEVKKTLPCKSLVECMSKEQTLLRVLHYPGAEDLTQQQEAGAIRAAPHEDINLITVLPAGSSKGLQVFSNQLGKWFEVPCIRGSIVINIGDMLQEMTAGRCSGAVL